MKRTSGIEKCLLIMSIMFSLLLTACGGGGGGNNGGDNNSNNNNPTTPNITISPEAKTIKLGESVTLTVTATNTGITWPSDSLVSGSYTTTGNTAVWTPPSTAGMYEFTVTATADTARKATAKITVEAAADDLPKVAAVIRSNVHVLSPAESKSFIESAEPVDIVDNNLVIKLSSTPAMSVGEIFMVRPTEENPMGFTGKVESINGNTITVSQPAIDEVFTSVKMNIEKQLNSDDIIDIVLADGVTLNDYQTASTPPSITSADHTALATGGTATFGDFSLSLKTVLYDHDKNIDTTNDQVVLRGKLGVKDISVKAVCDEDNLQTGKLDMEVSASAIVTTDVVIDVSGEYKISLKDALLKNKDKKKLIFEGIKEDNKLILGYLLFDLGTMSAQAGFGEPVITTLAGAIELTTTVAGEVSGNFSLGASYEAYLKTGFKTNNTQVEFIKEVKDNVTGNPKPNVHTILTAKVDIKSQATVGLDLAVYFVGVKFAAISNDFGVYVNANITAKAVDLDAEIFGSGNIALKLVGTGEVRLKAEKTFKILGKDTKLEFGIEKEPVEIYSILLFERTFPDIKMVLVEGGTFTMGCTAEQGDDCYDLEKTAHQVTLTNDFYIGKYEVTQGQWKAVMGEDNNPSYFKGDNLPVERVSWEDAQMFIQRLNERTGRNYRLPTEAEWEYAARGGNRSRGYKYSGSNNADDVAWAWDDTIRHPVGTKAANELGLHDMSGSVWEWVHDWFGAYSSGAQTNPTGALSGSYRAYRGGGGDDVWYKRVSNRDGDEPGSRYGFLGFRLASSSE